MKKNLPPTTEKAVPMCAGELLTYEISYVLDLQRAFRVVAAEEVQPLQAVDVLLQPARK